MEAKFNREVKIFCHFISLRTFVLQNLVRHRYLPLSITKTGTTKMHKYAPKGAAAKVRSPEPTVQGSKGLNSLWDSILSQWRVLSLDTWILEILAIALAIAALAGVLGILLVYQGRPLADWSHSISLNTALSFLATTMKGAMLLVVGRCFGQLKWIWYANQKRPLENFQIFDEA